MDASHAAYEAMVPDAVSLHHNSVIDQCAVSACLGTGILLSTLAYVALRMNLFLTASVDE